MDMHSFEDYDVVIDKQLNNRYLKKCIQCSPLRNKILTDIQNINNIINIINISIKNFIQFFQCFENYNNLNNCTLEIQSNLYNTGLKIINTNYENEIGNYLQLYNNLTYLEINNKIIINKEFIDEYNNIPIKRQFVSFHQTDDVVKKYLYEFVKNNISEKINNLVLFGGEMYIFQNLLDYNNLYAYSDYDSIIQDTLLNNKNNVEICKIDYDKFILNKKADLIICNTSKNGIGENLTKQLNSDKLIIISCNKKSFYKDYCNLLNKYNLIKCLEINNINIYLFNNNYVL